jgi:hypothetical protein
MGGRGIKKSVMSTVLIFLLVASCFSTIVPSDKKAVKLLKEYYSFYEEKEINAKIVNRGKFIKDCKCYPIEFFIDSDSGNNKRTFYFHKNGSGTIEIKKFKFGIKYSS